jgi:alkylated DNA repair dioxygenase AlkB
MLHLLLHLLFASGKGWLLQPFNIDAILATRAPHSSLYYRLLRGSIHLMKREASVKEDSGEGKRKRSITQIGPTASIFTTVKKGSSPTVHAIGPDDLECFYISNFVKAPLEVKRQLLSTLDVRQQSIMMFGKMIPEPRLTAFYGDKAYKYSNVLRQPIPFTTDLLAIKEAIESLPIIDALKFNGCLVNYYRKGDDSMGYHADNEKEIGPTENNRVIASISLGQERRFLFKRRSDQEVFEITLGCGSLLLMTGQTQSKFTHSLPKQAKATGDRLNLTFRVIV